MARGNQGRIGVLMSTHVVIDGYNLIFSDPAFAEIAERNLQQARDELVRLLSAYRTRSGSDITVVFDGAREALPQERMERHSGITVVFSGAGEKADSVVGEITERLVNEHSAESVVVVSSDREVSQRTRRRGAEVRGSREFANRVRARVLRKGRKRKRDDIERRRERPLSPREVEEWERLFQKRMDRGSGDVEE
jgi:predicted RNA-binding protein with PIN domain